MGLVDTVNFGWFSFIAKPLLWLLRALFGLVGNWGIAIILLTVLVKLATLYWTNKSMKSMKAMAALKPEMEALQKKYGDDRQKMQEAQMALFKRHGVNPLAGCLPMLLQMPIWMGLYQMLSHAGELHQAVFIPGWLTDLTERDPYFILPVALTGFMFLQSKLQPMTTTDSAQQKILMYGMPLMFGGMGLFFPAGLTVYITTNTLLGIAHTLYMKRSGDPVKPVAKPAEDDDAKATKADKAEAKPVKAEAKPAKAADADDDADSDDDDADDAESAPEPTAGKGGSTGGGGGKPKAGAQRRGQRKGKRR
jgi:YidC/Oxa1 family membrane protein insertase